MKNAFENMMREEDGQGLVEYGLIIAGIALAAIAVIFLLGDDINTFFTNVRTGLTA